ncbi:MAG: hypothetical protein ACO30P_00325 [Candidatus Kapaibacteriota bacterium]
MMVVYYLLALLLGFGTLFCQQPPNQTWYFGKFGGLRFNNAIPNPITGKLDTWEGCAVLSDPATGNPILYSDGKKLYQADGSVVPGGGDAIKSGISSTQCCIFIPDPADAQRVYLFTAPDLTGMGSSETKSFYSHISLQGNPSVITSNVLIQDNMSEKIAGTQNCADNSYWVLYHHKAQSRIFAYKVTSAGVSTNPVISSYSNLNNFYNVGAMKISPDGSKLVVVSEADGFNYLQTIVLFDFNLQTGQASNPKFLAKNKCYGNYGAAFSPNSKRLFTTGTLDKQQSSEAALFQFDLVSDNEATIAASMWTLPLGTRKLFGLQLGPDGKIYAIADRPNQLDVINKPNMLGSQIEFSTNVLNQSGKTVLGLPTMIDYNLGISIDTLLACQSSGIIIGAPPMQGYSYAWSPSIGLSNAFIANPLAKPSQPTTYTLVVTNPFGCQTRQTVHVGLLPAVNVSYEIPNSICKGGKVQLKASGASRYSWFPSYGLSATNIANPFASPDSTTTYYLVASNSLCSDTIPIRVDVVPFPKADAGPDKTTCPGGSVEIGVNPKSGHTYNWLPDKYVSNAFLSKTIASPPTDNFPFILKVTNEYGCVAYDTVIVKIENTLVAKTSVDTTICRGDILQLRASGGSTYRWFQGENISDTTSSTPVVRPINNSTYGVIVSSGSCIDTAFIAVNVIQGISADAGKDQSTCPGESVSLGTALQNGASYSWTPVVFLDNSKSPTPTCSPTASTEYILTVISNAGCISRDTVKVTVADKLEINMPADTSTCFGVPLTIKPIGGQTYRWYPPIGINDTNSAEPIFTPQQTTTYYVEAKNGNCKGNDSVTITVLPLPNLDAGQDQSICLGDTIILSAQGATSYTWFTKKDGDIGNGSQLSISPVLPTMYYVRGSNGACSILDSIVITLKPQPQIVISGDTLICAGNTATLNAQGADSYEWNDDTTIISKNNGQLLIKPTKDTYYYFKGKKDGCSTEIDSILVKVLQSLPIIKNAEKVTCKNKPILISIFPSKDIVVSGDCSTLSNSNDSLFVIPNSSGYISVKGNRNGCISLDSFYVEVKDLPDVKLPRDTVICMGSSIEITANGADDYQWESSDSYDSLAKNSIVFKNVSNSIRVKSIGNNGYCSSFDEMNIDVRDPMVLPFSLTFNQEMIPGIRLPLQLNIPSGIDACTLLILYDSTSSVIESHKVVSGSSLTTTNQTRRNGEYALSVQNPKYESGQIEFTLYPYLPAEDIDSNTYSLKLQNADSNCTTYELKDCIIPYSKSCAWSLRPVQTLKSYQLSVVDNQINIRSAFTEKLNCRIISLDGRTIFHEIVQMQAGEQSSIQIPIDIPIGIYAISIQGSLWQEIYLMPKTEK